MDLFEGLGGDGCEVHRSILHITFEILMQYSRSNLSSVLYISKIPDVIILLWRNFLAIKIKVSDLLEKYKMTHKKFLNWAGIQCLQRIKLSSSGSILIPGIFSVSSVSLWHFQCLVLLTA